MKVIFCKIAWMEYYNGVKNTDKPVDEESWITEADEIGECNNFTPNEDGNYYGYVQTKSGRGKNNKLHIDKIEGMSEEDDKAEGVLVIWVAKDPSQNKINIIGWYKNATVLKKYQYNEDNKEYNIYAKMEDCVLLPINKRHKIVPKAGRGGSSYGMGSSNIWYGKKDDKNAETYIKNMINYINSYNGDNIAMSSNY